MIRCVIKGYEYNLYYEGKPYIGDEPDPQVSWCGLNLVSHDDYYTHWCQPPETIVWDNPKLLEDWYHALDSKPTNADVCLFCRWEFNAYMKKITRRMAKQRGI